MIFLEKRVLLLVFFILSISGIYAQSETDDLTLIMHYFDSFKKLNNSSPSEQVTQLGMENTIYITSESSNHQLNQLGTNNTIEFISFYGRDDLSLEVNQFGQENYIQILGENELIKSMKITQKGSHRILKIRNN